MAAVYPGALPSKEAAGANLSTNPHSQLHDDMYDEIVAIATELGTDPADTAATVKARIQAAERQGVPRFASAAARNSAMSGFLTEGLVAYLIDSNTLTVYTGAAWSTVGPVHGAWGTWVPEASQNSALVTSTINYARQMRMGRTIMGHFMLTITGTGTAGSAVLIGGSGVITAATSGIMVGAASIYDSSSNVSPACLGLSLGSATHFDLREPRTGSDNRIGIAGGGFGGALGSGDIIRGQYVYEAAADA